MKLRKFLHAAFQLSLFDFEPTTASSLRPPDFRKPAPIPPLSPDGQQKSKSRHVQTPDQTIEYTLRRSTRRSIGFTIEDDGLRVTAPRWVTIAEIEDGIRSKQRWIIRKLHEKQKQIAQQQAPLKLCDGAPISFLGKSLTLRLCASGKRDVSLDEDSGTVTVALPPDTSEEQLKKRVVKWLQNEAYRLYSQRLPYYAEKLDVTYDSFALSSANTQWGSCTVGGRIRLNWRMIHLPLHLIDYVIAHELSHLREMNHSPRFWATVKIAFPEYMNARKILRDHSPKGLPAL